MSKSVSDKIIIGVAVIVLATVILGGLTFYGRAQAQGVIIEYNTDNISDIKGDIRDISKGMNTIGRNIAVQTETLKSIDGRLKKIEEK